MNTSSGMKLVLCYLLCFGGSRFSLGTAETVTSFTKESDGALCQLSGGAKLKLQVCAGNIIRVVYTSQSAIPDPQGYVVSQAAFSPGTWDATENASAVILTTPRVTAKVAKSDALVSFATASGTAVASETERTLTAVAKAGQNGFSGTLNFASPSAEGVYGLGNLSAASGGWTENDYWASATLPPDRTGRLNIRDFTFDMHQSNWMDVIPFFMTTSGYGILMNFCCHATKTAPLNFTADFLLNNSWDYFFIYGPQFDTIVSGYRNLTGPAPMLPKWAFGLWQCKNAYSSASQLIGVVDTFRTQGIPVDCIVQDWNWWTGGPTGRGSFTWNATNYPDPTGMVTALHKNNCHLAVSVWPTFSTNSVNYAAMKPHLLTSMTCSGSETDPGIYMNIFDTAGARMFWNYMNASCFSIGVDAWWMDATEPECPQLTGAPVSGGGVIDQFSNIYALAHAKNIFENQRPLSAAKRVTNLTRSFYAGEQRYGTIYWNGDLSSSDMKNVATTVSGGINSSMAGNPYWCSDIGGFQNTLTDETLIRWFEVGTFFPIFRVHGTRATEIYNMSDAARPIALAFTHLRYRLMPYIYSLAWKVTSEGYTVTRALWFDFPGDANVINIADQYMFGPSLLINPVATVGATKRSVYLPAGTWYDFWTGTPSTGATGRIVNDVSAPLPTIPIYAKAGAILPLGPRIQFATQKQPDTIELRVYPGADGSFTLYEDEGDNYNYETGKYATIPITYVDNARNVIIGARSGSFIGMDAKKVFTIVFVSSNHGKGDEMTVQSDCQLVYTGEQVSCNPLSVSPERFIGAEMLPIDFTSKAAVGTVMLPNAFSGKTKEITVFDCSGRLLKKAVIKKNVVDLRKDFELLTRVYIVKARAIR